MARIPCPIECVKKICIQSRKRLTWRLMSRLVVKRPAGRTHRTRVVKEILYRIFSGEYKGGDRLVEEELAATIGVSRTPIREALTQLATIGVIALKANHGAVVRPFGPVQLRELYHVRRVLECEAT